MKQHDYYVEYYEELGKCLECIPFPCTQQEFSPLFLL